jgi:hypothetical protein
MNYGRGEHRNELVWADEIGAFIWDTLDFKSNRYTKPDHEQDVNEHGGSLRNTRISIAGYQGLKLKTAQILSISRLTEIGR